jgi:hypothetical protein
LDGLRKKAQVGILFAKFRLPDEAERLYKEVIAGESEHYGPNHVSTLLNKGRLANLRWRQGHVDEGRDTFRQVVAGFEQQLSPEHPYLVWAKGALAQLESF